MKRWGLRHRGFRVGFIGVVVSSVFFLVGFSAPAWKNTGGLWMDCSSTYGLCATHHALRMHLPAWFDAVRVFECLAIVAMILCIMEEVYMDFLSQPSPDRRASEVLALAAGTLGLVGCIIYAAFTPMTSSSGRHHNPSYLSWGFGLVTTSSCSLIAFASVMAYFRHRGLDVVGYSASNAMHYQVSDGSVTPVGGAGLDICPPSYTEVMSQPGGSQVTAGPLPSEYVYYKHAGFPDAQPPPYVPPPPGAQFEAPPPYAPAESQTGPGLSSQESSSTPQPTTAVESAASGVVSCGGGAGDAPPASDSAIVVSARMDPVSADQSSLPQPQVCAGTSPVSPDPSVPVYYVTVLDQMVPVFLEELQQAGRDVPSGLVPAYYIMIHGQHVPVYSEEQASCLNS